MSADDLMIELAGKVAYLEAQVAAQDRLLMALTLAQPRSRRVEFLELLTALQLNAQAVGEAGGARLMSLFAERAMALLAGDLQASHADMLLSLHSETLLHAKTPADLKDAQQSWLSIATPDEIEQELVEHMRPVLAAAADAKRKKNQKGG